MEWRKNRNSTLFKCHWNTCCINHPMVGETTLQVFSETLTLEHQSSICIGQTWITKNTPFRMNEWKTETYYRCLFLFFIFFSSVLTKDVPDWGWIAFVKSKFCVFVLTHVLCQGTFFFFCCIAAGPKSELKKNHNRKMTELYPHYTSKILHSFALFKVSLPCICLNL